MATDSRTPNQRDSRTSVDAADIRTAQLSDAAQTTAIQDAQRTIIQLQNTITQLQEQRKREEAPQTVMYAYSYFNSDDIVKNTSQRTTYGMWSGGTGSLTTFFQSSTQSGSSGNYYYDVYDKNPASDSTAAKQFIVAYGHRTGGGSVSLATDNNSTVASKAVYAQFRNILLSPDVEKFTFAGNVQRDDIFVIKVRRSRLKQKMDAGNWQLRLRNGTKYLNLIDDSQDVFDQLTSNASRVYNIVSGSLVTGATSSIHTAASNESGGGYGLFYPDWGILVLQPYKLKTYLGITVNSGTTAYTNNHGTLFTAISNGALFTARSEETITSTQYFCRVKNREYNFSNNPTFYTSSDARLRVSSFVGNPSVYITSVGLYNTQNELLAVAKLSQPILKNFEKEALINVKLDF